MYKKIVSIGILLAMTFSLFACIPIVPEPGNELAEYKLTAKTGLETYATEKGQSNYTADNWLVLLGYVAEGKDEIDAAANKPAVDSAVEKAEQAIDDVPQKEEEVGTFYSLQEAYDEGLLTIQNLMSIAYYHGSLDSVDGTFVPTTKNPEVLSAETVLTIKQSWISELGQSHVEATIDDVIILKYYGTYGGCIALIITDNYSEDGGDGDYIIIAEVLFTYSSLNRILIWK